VPEEQLPVEGLEV
jgi:hypothetical protein